MKIKMEEINGSSLLEAMEIWNSVVLDGRAFPQMEVLNPTSAKDFFKEQTYTGVAKDEESGKILGVYILHPNNVGRCGHICNASYAVKKEKRGLHIGEYLVKDCIEKAREKGFGVLQFNAVVKSNTSALRLYKKLGFTQLGVIPKGFLNVNNEYEDIIPHYISL